MFHTYNNPTRLVHGPGSLGQIANLAKEFGISRAALFTDKIIAGTPFYKQAIKDLDASGLDYYVYDDCPVDARVKLIDEEGARAVAEKADGVICIGGGSPICMAKGVAVVATNGGSVRDYNGSFKVKKRPLPVIVVPTTAGSGSEVSPFTIIKDEERKLKVAMHSPLTYPNAAILDPVTMETLPSKASGVAAMDALTHAVEAYTSPIATPLTDALALKAIEMMSKYLHASIVENTEEGRSQHMLASAIANQACGNARLGLAHCLSRSLDAFYHPPHGIAVGTLMPITTVYSIDDWAPKLPEMAAAFQIADVDPDPHNAVRQIEAKMYDIFDMIEFDRHITDPDAGPAKHQELSEYVYKVRNSGDEPAADKLILSDNTQAASVKDAAGLFAQVVIA